METFTIIGIISIHSILPAWAQDIAPNVYCNTQIRTWQQAKADCLKVKGTLVAYATGLDQNVAANINLNSDVDVWTADYASEYSQQANSNKRLCGFYLMTKTMSKTMSNIQELFGDCSASRFYLCKNISTMKFDVFKSTRDSIRCPGRINRIDLQYYSKENIKLGCYYWTSRYIHVITGKATQQSLGNTPVLCGAYKTDIGKYFVNCSVGRKSLCNISFLTNHANNVSDKRCFVNQPANSTPKTVSHTTRSATSRSNNTVQSTEKSSENAIIKAETEPTHTVTTVSDDKKIEKQKGNDSNLGVTVGLPVGLCIALIGGIVLSIYISRRYRCWKTYDRKSDLKETVSWNNKSSMGKGIDRFNKIDENTSISVIDPRETNVEPTQKYENSFKYPIPEYAVVHKNNLKCNAEGKKANPSPLEKRRGHAHNLDVVQGNNSYCCAKFESPGDLNQLPNSAGKQTSEYSFAKETTGDVGVNGQVRASAREDEYDVTSNVRSHEAADNVYNKLQGDSYVSNTDVTRDGLTGNVYNSSQNQVSENFYDSAKQIDQTGATDNIYNHLFKAETYSDVSSSKMQQSKVADQTYSKLK